VFGKVEGAEAKVDVAGDVVADVAGDVAGDVAVNAVVNAAWHGLSDAVKNMYMCP